jgi:hypothetical protein
VRGLLLQGRRVKAGALPKVAAGAERVQVARVVGSAAGDRHDVVDVAGGAPEPSEKPEQLDGGAGCSAASTAIAKATTASIWLRTRRPALSPGGRAADTAKVRVDDLERWLNLEGYVRRPRTGQAALDRGTVATLDCPHCAHGDVRMLAFERREDRSYQAVAWCAQRKCREAVEI